MPNAATYKKLQELLRSLSTGLRHNRGIENTVLLEFSRTVLARFVTEMCQQDNALRARELQAKYEQDSRLRPQHSLLLAPEPKRFAKL